MFAAPLGAEEFVWREQARDLHALLVGSIPLEERRAYLGDMRIAQDMTGIAHVLNKAARARTDEPPPGIPIVPPTPQPERVADPSSASSQPQPAPVAPAHILPALEALLAADGLDDLHDVVEQHPVLLAPEVDDVLDRMADDAVEQRAYTVADGLHRTRMLLGRIRTEGLDSMGKDAAPVAPPPAEAAASQPPQSPAVSASPAAPPTLPTDIYQALLQAQTSQALADLVEEYPVLLEEWVDATLSEAVNQILEENNETLAHRLEQRRELLDMMRQELVRQEALDVLLSADDDETLAQVLIDYPVLLTDEAQQALWHLASDARARGDDELAVYAVECRAMLRKVRDELSNE
jgi:hypothetical protein